MRLRHVCHERRLFLPTSARPIFCPDLVTSFLAAPVMTSSNASILAIKWAMYDGRFRVTHLGDSLANELLQALEERLQRQSSAFPLYLFRSLARIPPCHTTIL